MAPSTTSEVISNQTGIMGEGPFEGRRIVESLSRTRIGRHSHDADQMPPRPEPRLHDPS